MIAYLKNIYSLLHIRARAEIHVPFAISSFFGRLLNPLHAELHAESFPERQSKSAPAQKLRLQRLFNAFEFTLYLTKFRVMTW